MYQQPPQQGGHPPPYGPPGAPYGYAAPGGTTTAPGGGRRPGRAARIWGVLLVVFGVFPLLVGAVVVAFAVKNAQRTESNDAFSAKAWHNLPSEQIFPPHLQDTSVGQRNRGWTRQAVFDDAPCDGRTLQGPFLRQARAAGCTRVLTAAYVDNSGKTAATVALVVTRSYADARQLGEQFSQSKDAAPTSRPVAPPVKPRAAKGTLAAHGYTIGGAAAAVGLETTNAPYAVAVTAGPTDTHRKYGRLPGPWRLDALAEMTLFPKVADDLAGIYSRSFPMVIEGKEKSWGA